MYTVLYWINFQNIHNFTYQKSITSYTFLLVFKIVESLPCVLKVKKSENGYSFFHTLSQTKPSNSSVTLFAVQLLGIISRDVLNFYITFMTIKLYLFYLDDGKKNYLSTELSRTIYFFLFELCKVSCLFP